MPLACSAEALGQLARGSRRGPRRSPAQVGVRCRQWPRPAHRRRRGRRAAPARCRRPAGRQSRRRDLRLPLSLRFADADDGGEARRERGLGLLPHQGVGFAMQRAPFGVADNDVARASVGQHGGADFAGAGGVGGRWRCSPGRRSAQRRHRPCAGGCEIRRRRADQHVDTRQRRASLTDEQREFRPDRRSGRYIFQFPAINGLRAAMRVPPCFSSPCRAIAPAWGRLYGPAPSAYRMLHALTIPQTDPRLHRRASFSAWSAWPSCCFSSQQRELQRRPLERTGARSASMRSPHGAIVART